MNSLVHLEAKVAKYKEARIIFMGIKLEKKIGGNTYELFKSKIKNILGSKTEKTKGGRNKFLETNLTNILTDKTV